MKKMYRCRKLLLALCLVCSVFRLPAQNFNLEWVRQVGGGCWNDSEEDAVTTVALGNSGSVYSAGYFCGTSDFDPGAGNMTMTAIGSNIFIYKLTASGALAWAKQINTTKRNIAITTDVTGNVYATGTYEGTVDFDPGPDSFKLSSSANPGQSYSGAFILKLDTAGNFVWVKGLGNAGYTISANDISLDSAGNVYTTGVFFNTADFNPAINPADTFKLTASGSSDIYISKLTNTGDFVWAKKMGGSGADAPVAMVADPGGNVYTTGSFKATADFDPGTAITNLTATGYADVFLSKLDASGNMVWAKAFLAEGPVSAFNRVVAAAIAVDTAGNVYSTGNFGGSIDFDPGGTVNNLTSTGSNDQYGYISKLDAAGNFVWAKKRKGISYDLVLDAAGNNYTTGMFTGLNDFDPGAGTVNLAAAGGSDIFVTSLNSNGDFVSVKGFGGTSYDKGYAIVVEPSGKNIYTVGSFAAYEGGQADFDPGPASVVLVSGSGAGGDSDGFIHKMSCNSYGTLTTIACDSFTFAGTTYTESGTYTGVLPNATGCDSIITLNLTVHQSSGSTLTETACNSYSLNGQTYTSSGSYIVTTLPNAAGCDSVVLLELTIHTLDITVTENATGLHANQTGATYQWLDCNNQNAPVSGETLQDFNPQQNGSYAVIVTSDACTDTSACHSFAATAIHDTAPFGLTRIFPNPAFSKLTLNTTLSLKEGTIRLSDITGRLKAEWTNLKGNHFTFDIRTLPSGTYILELKEKDKQVKLKVTKL
jgi:hypothetical protein